MNRSQRRRAKRQAKGNKALKSKSGTQETDVLGDIYNAIRIDDKVLANSLLKDALVSVPDNPDVHHLHGVILGQLGDREDAIGHIRNAIRLNDQNAEYHANLGFLLMASGDIGAAKSAYEASIKLAPTDATGHARLAKLLEAEGNLEAAAAAHLQAVKADPDFRHSWIALARLGTKSGKLKKVAHYIYHILRIDPVIANEFEGAEICVGILHGLQDFNIKVGIGDNGKFSFSPQTGHFDATLAMAGSGFSVRDIFLLPGAPVEKIRRSLAGCHVVFNSIADVDTEGKSLELAETILADVSIPIINQPNAARQTGRDEVADAIGSIAGIRAPRTATLAAGTPVSDIQDLSTELGITFPLLYRPKGGHTGEGLLRLEDAHDLDGLPKDVFKDDGYLSEFIEFKSADGFHRKSRAFWIEGELFPEHHVISDNWIVHIEARERLMSAHPWMIEEQRQFIEEFTTFLSAAQIDALKMVGSRLGLDFLGIDFSILPDGRLLVFEANFAMNINLEGDPELFPYKVPATMHTVERLRKLMRTKAMDGKAAGSSSRS